MKKVIIIAVLLVVSVAIRNKPRLEPEVLGTPQHTNEPVNFSVCGWIPWWNYDKALSELHHYETGITIVSPFVFSLQKDYSIKQHISSERLTFSDYAVIPTVSDNGEGKVVSEIINDPILTKKHIDDLQKILEGNSFAGIEIDYENLLPSDNEAFTKFISQLALALQETDSLLVVTVSPHDPETEAQLNWQELSDHADYIRIMAYDYSWSATEPGPIAPLEWVWEIAHDAEVIPKQKRILGIGLYGYEWNIELGTVRSISLDMMDSIINQGAIVTYDETYHSPFTVTDNRELWFENTKSIQEK